MAASVPQMVACAIRGPILHADLPGLFRRICAVLDRSDAEVLLCDVSGAEPDAVTVEALARLQLAVGRRGRRARLCFASAELLELIEFMGLRDLVPKLGVESER
jgi:MFS superfamily sulfate permease-like transporter